MKAGLSIHLSIQRGSNLKSCMSHVSQPPPTHAKRMVAGVVSMLNSATGTPLAATWGANMAAGYTTEEVPTCRPQRALLGPQAGKLNQWCGFDRAPTQ